MDHAAAPSLLRFVLARLDDEEGLIIGNTPFVGDAQVSPDFHARYLDRGGLLQRCRSDRDLVATCVQAMSEAQGPPPVPVPAAPDPVTVLGSEIIKLIALRYADHPDYDPSWNSV
jgi:hypothetical protein